MLSNPDSSEELYTSDCKADDELTTHTGSDGNLAAQSGPDSDLDKGMKNLSLNSIETKAEIHIRRKSSAPPDLSRSKQELLCENHKKSKLPAKEIQSQSSISSMDSVNTGTKPKLKKKRSGSGNTNSSKSTSATCKFTETNFIYSRPYLSNFVLQSIRFGGL